MSAAMPSSDPVVCAVSGGACNILLNNKAVGCEMQLSFIMVPSPRCLLHQWDMHCALANHRTERLEKEMVKKALREMCNESSFEKGKVEGELNLSLLTLVGL